MKKSVTLLVVFLFCLMINIGCNKKSKKPSIINQNKVENAQIADNKKEDAKKQDLSTKPLENGVIFDNELSIAIAYIKREPQTTTIWLALKCVNKSWNSRIFEIVIYDDRGNEYKNKFHVASYRNAWLNDDFPAIPENLPLGFTWISGPIKISMPFQAPITKIELVVNSKNVELNFKDPISPSLSFEPKKEEVIRPGEEIKLDKNLSLKWQGRIKIEKDNNDGSTYAVLSSVIIKNHDYNSQDLPEFRFYIQFNNGGIASEPFYLGSPTEKIPDLSTKTIDYRVNIDIRRGNNTGIRMILLYYENIQGVTFYRLITPEQQK